jgi:hypothetical protein
LVLKICAGKSSCKLTLPFTISGFPWHALEIDGRPSFDTLPRYQPRSPQPPPIDALLDEISVSCQTTSSSREETEGQTSPLETLTDVGEDEETEPLDYLKNKDSACSL